MRKPGRLSSATVTAALAVAAVTGCATLPTSGDVRLGALHGSGGNAGQVGVQILPVPPGLHWPPMQIVRGFLAASASSDNHYVVAREYLTPGYSRRWQPGWAATVLGVPDITQPQPAGRPLPGSPPGTWIDVTSKYVAKMTTAAPYEAGNLVVSSGPNDYQFRLTDDNGHYRISDIYLNGHPTSPTILLLTQPDFERDYQTRNLYFFPAGGTSAHTLIPDPVPVPLQATGAQEVRGLVRSLFSSPPGTSWLNGAAVTAFPGPVPMRVRVVGGIKAIVNLGGKAAKAGQARLSRMAAQIYATLTSSPYSPSPASQIQSVVLEVNNRVVRQPLPPPYANWIPRVGAGSPAGQLYFQDTAAELPAPAVETLKDGKPVSVSLPGGVGGAPFTAMAVTPGPPSQAVLAGCVGDKLYLMPRWQGGTQVSRILPANCTSLSWDSSRNLWLTAGGNAYKIPGAGTAGHVGPVTVVYCPACSGTRSTSLAIGMLRIAPDEVRVAMIVHTRSSSQVMIGAISSGPSFTYVGNCGVSCGGKGAGRTTKLVPVGTDVPNPSAVAWLDPDHLLVLDHGGSAAAQIYEVPLNGGPSTPLATPRYAQWLAASWPESGSLPQVVVGVTGSRPGSQSEILTFIAGLFNRGWSTVAKGTLPVLPG
ncbi:MAG TPA: LpqB family beta-propeller domain-containing protein [Streptosporangiaceae bacterium]